ncbi:unnamed protein product, partial [Knipowitschia caucasica]
MTTSVCD